jgi:hypothetical protein
MWRALISVAAGLVMLAAGAVFTPAMAQWACGKRADLLAQLALRYGEVSSAIGITDQGALLDLVVSPGGTWTIMMTVPGGPTCIVATGKQWETLPAVVEDPGV